MSKRQNSFFFIRNLRAFCIYFLQVLKIRIWGYLLFAGIACEIYLLMPSNFDKKILSFFLKHQKLFVKEAKLFFFNRNLRAFCIYFLQVLKIRIWGYLLFAGIAFKIYLLMPSNFDEKIPFDYDWFCPLKTMAFINLKALPSANTFHCFLREKTVYFSDEVFPLRFRGYFKQQCTSLHNKVQMECL